MKPAEGSTVIGKSVVIRGELSGEEDLFMDGDIEGTITLKESRLTVGPNARVLADINVRDIVVFGNVTGNVRASGRIELCDTATISGDIFASRLSIEENATIQGRVELIAPAVAASTPAPVHSMPATPPAVQTTLADIKD
jgi:cytoskeletal protein CcmA (bactofilin family)